MLSIVKIGLCTSNCAPSINFHLINKKSIEKFCCQLYWPECEPPEVVEVGGVGEEDHAAVVPAEPSPVQVILHTVPCFGYQPMTMWIMEIK